MPFDEDELKELSVADLTDICTRLKLSTKGKKSTMIDRILNCEKNPEAAEREDDEEPEQPPPPKPPLPLQQQEETFESVANNLGLHTDTKKMLLANNFGTIRDLRNLTSLDCSRMNMPLHDEKDLMAFNGKAVAEPVVLRVEQEKFRTKPVFNQVQPANHALPPVRQKACASLLGEFIREDDDEISELQLPQRARDLPRPHTLMQPRESQRTVEPHDVAIAEFVSESVRIISRLAKSPPHAEALVEYSEYIEFLTQRSVDYTVKSVLAFDNEFRSRAAFEKVNLCDSDLRRSISDRHFHAATRYARKPYQAVNQPFRGQFRASAGGQSYAATAASGIAPVCLRFNRGSCTPPCRYQHRCANCGDQSHAAPNCQRPVAQQQQHPLYNGR